MRFRSGWFNNGYFPCNTISRRQKVFRPDTDQYLLAGLERGHRGQVQTGLANHRLRASNRVNRNGSLDHIHRWRADKPCHKSIRRAVIKLERTADLFDMAVLHHHDLIGHGHRFNLIMRHIYRGGF